jgi:MraZ protein
MFRGSYSARVDDKGRFKIPADFLKGLTEEYGEDQEFFVTSWNGHFARLYPLREWVKLERKLASASSVNPSRKKFLNLVNYYGQQVALDKQGRLLLPSVLRESADLRGEVTVLGSVNCIDVWNKQRYVEDIRKNPLTAEDFKALDELGV